MSARATPVYAQSPLASPLLIALADGLHAHHPRPPPKSGATYDKRDGKLQVAATVTAELVADNYKPRAPGEASGNSYIAGAGYEHLSPTAYWFVEVRELQ